MKDKSFAVIGLGQFGMTLAVTLAEADCDVLAIDEKEELIQEIAEKVTYAVKADVREPGILKSLGVQNVDVAIIAISENLEASITATMQAKDLGVPFVMAKAINALHGRILDKIGADEVIYPEQSMGLRVARNLLSSGFWIFLSFLRISVWRNSGFLPAGKGKVCQPLEFVKNIRSILSV